MSFIPSIKSPSNVEKNALWFLFQGSRLFVKKEGQNYSILQSLDLEAIAQSPTEQQYLGTLDGRHCYAGESSGDVTLTESLSLKDLRALFERLDKELIWLAGMANHLVYWNQNHKYCGKCGHLTENKTDERAKLCPECGLVNYPRLSPAVIVAVIRDNQILLAHSPSFPAKFYSVLAGFVEPGETLKECVKREVREEVGISLKNIRYFGSQPWPFPDSLMLGFIAEYAGGEIDIDHSEISDAGWFTPQNMPAIPSKISIARQLIDWFLETNGIGK